MSEQERPPIFKNWNSWYWIVIAVMLIQVISYTVITQSFR
jgi:hypothetical protein